MRPVNVYINWSSYDELSDNVELTETLAMQELDEFLRLRKHGVVLDYYLMDAFWYDPDGALMTWRKPHWKNGPGRWLKKCLDNDVKPGLWLPTNCLSSNSKMKPRPEWKDSLNRDGTLYCLFRGSFLNGLMKVMDYWYRQGVRLYKFDFANFAAATPDAEKEFSPEEISSRNEQALRLALGEFRQAHPEILLVAYNNFGGQIVNTSIPFAKNVDLRWLDCFDALYCGDPRPADIPCMNFWRSKDIYSDHMVKDYFRNGIPLERMDSSAFMIGKTGTCYHRGTEAWRGMLVLSLCRGNWFNTYYGNLELLDRKDAKWFAKVQSILLPLQALGRTYLLGGIPGKNESYGYANVVPDGSIYAWVNPSQEIREIEIKEAAPYQKLKGKGRILFCDSGFAPVLKGKALTLGPEQLCVVGFGKYGDAQFDMGIQQDVVIPKTIVKISAKFAGCGLNQRCTKIKLPSTGKARIVMRQSRNGMAVRTTGGSPPKGVPLDQLLKIEAAQQGRCLPLTINYGKAIWSGLSWAVAELDVNDAIANVPVEILVSSSEKDNVDISVEIYQVT
jgi:hypothetical protein